MLLKDIGFLALRFVGSWLGIASMVFVGILILDSSAFLRGLLTVVSGVLGAYAAYLLHYGARRPNPYQKLQRIWTLPRWVVTLMVSSVCILVAIGLLFKGIFPDTEGANAAGAFVAAANGFFFFGAVYGIAGLLSVSDARQQLVRAPFDRKQKWREEASHPDRQPSVVNRIRETAYRLSLVPASRVFRQSIESKRAN